MTGYTPLDSGILDGTLYGKWPHNGLFALLLSQSDRYGRIDMVPKLLASKIGVSEEMLLGCIADFMEPDPGSRTGDLEGRRLELLDPDVRNWGWRIVNHGIYRERHRKAGYDEARTASGKDAERKKAERDAKAAKDAVPRSPDASREVPLSSHLQLISSPTSTPNKSKSAKRASRSRVSPEIVESVFTCWKVSLNHPKAVLDQKRLQAITGALELGFGPDELCACFVGYTRSEWHRQNKVHGLHVLLKDAEHIERGITIAMTPPPRTFDEIRADSEAKRAEDQANRAKVAAAMNETRGISLEGIVEKTGMDVEAAEYYQRLILDDFRAGIRG